MKGDRGERFRYWIISPTTLRSSASLRSTSHLPFHPHIPLFQCAARSPARDREKKVDETRWESHISRRRAPAPL